MANLHLTATLLLTLFKDDNLSAKSVFTPINKEFEFLIIFITLSFIFILLIFSIIYYIVKRSNAFYLYNICAKQRDYLQDVSYTSVPFPTLRYRPQEKITNGSNGSLNVTLYISWLAAFISLIVFLFSYLFYHGYI